MNELPATSGIYLITCTATNKIYVGSATNMHTRQHQHLYLLRTNKHRNTYLQRSFNKYGEDAFVFSVAEFVEVDRLIEREQVWIDTRQACDQQYGYNVSPTAGSPRGVKHSAATRAKLSAARKGRPKSAEHRAKIKASNQGKKRSPETRAKLSAARKGKKLSPEHLEKLRSANKGRKLSPEHIEKVRATLKGRSPSPATLEAARLAKAQNPKKQRVRVKRPHGPKKGTPKTLEHKRAIKNAHQQPAAREKARERTRQAWSSEEYREKQQAAYQAATNNPEFQARRVAALKAATSTPEYRAKQRAASAHRFPHIKAKIPEIRALYATGQYSHRELAKQFGIGQSTIGRILSGETWTDD